MWMPLGPVLQPAVEFHVRQCAKEKQNVSTSQKSSRRTSVIKEAQAGGKGSGGWAIQV